MHAGEDREYKGKPPAEGSWPYLTDQDPREDIFVVAGGCKNKQNMSLSYVVALAHIKLRLVDRAACCRVFCNHAEGQCALNVVPGGKMVRTGLEQSLMYDRHTGTAKQELLAEEYLALVNQRNAHMLSALVDPEEMLEQPTPEYFVEGDVSEAHVVLLTCTDLFEEL